MLGLVRGQLSSKLRTTWCGLTIGASEVKELGGLCLSMIHYDLLVWLMIKSVVIL